MRPTTSSGWPHAAPRHRKTRLMIILSVLAEFLVVEATTPPPTPSVPAAMPPLDTGDDSGGEATGVVAGIIIALLTLVGLFLYYWYSRRERQNEKSREAVLEQQKQAFIESPPFEEEDGRGEGYPVPAVIPPLPPPNGSAVSPPFTGESEENNNLVSTFNTNPEPGMGVGGGMKPATNQYELKVGDKIIARRSEVDETLEAGRVMQHNPDGTFSVQFDDGKFDRSIPSLWVFPMGRFTKGDRVVTRSSRSATITSFMGPSLYEVKLDGGGFETASSVDLTSSVYSGEAMPLTRSNTTALPPLQEEDELLSLSQRKIHKGNRDRDRYKSMPQLPNNPRRMRNGAFRGSLGTAADPLSKSLSGLSVNTVALEALAGMHLVAVSPISATPRSPGLSRGSFPSRQNTGEMFTSMKV